MSSSMKSLANILFKNIYTCMENEMYCMHIHTHTHNIYIYISFLFLYKTIFNILSQSLLIMIYYYIYVR